MEAGDQFTNLAVPLAAVLVLDAGPAQMGYLAAANLVPYLLFSLHAGAWVDRRGRRRQLMVGTDLGPRAAHRDRTDRLRARCADDHPALRSRF